MNKGNYCILQLLIKLHNQLIVLFFWYSETGVHANARVDKLQLLLVLGNYQWHLITPRT